MAVVTHRYAAVAGVRSHCLASSGRIRAAGGFVVALATLLATAAAQAQVDVEAGRTVYRTVCELCHARDPMTDRPGSAARKDAGVLRAIESISSMRWLRGRLSDSDIDNVQAWLDFVVLPADAVRPQTGWYWNPAQPGRGFFFEYGEGYASFAAYFYAEDGRADWALGSARYNGLEQPLSLPLSQFVDGQEFAAAAWRPAAELTVLPADLHMRSPQALVLHLDAVLPLPLQRLAFDLGEAPRPARPGMPEAGWWWDPDTPGSGYALEVQGNDLFIAAYTYDEAGDATWLSAFGPVSADLRFAGAWQRFSGGQGLQGDFRPAQETPDGGGRVDIRFLSTRSAMLTLPDGRQVSIERFF